MMDPLKFSGETGNKGTVSIFLGGNENNVTVTIFIWSVRGAMYPLCPVVTMPTYDCIATFQ
jgi:hypothetical protein